MNDVALIVLAGFFSGAFVTAFAFTIAAWFASRFMPQQQDDVSDEEDEAE